MRGESFEDLECWQAAYRLKRRIWEEVAPHFPKEERFELKSQIIRAARSSTANIAEGWGRYHYLDSRKFYLNSRGSQAEILDHLLEARDCNYISPQLFDSLKADLNTSLRLLNGYIRYLNSKFENKG